MWLRAIFWSVLLAAMPCFAAAAFAGHAAAGAEPPAAGSWGDARAVPGGEIDDMSCPSAGNCAAAGTSTQYGEETVFVVSETNGTWGSPVDVPDGIYLAHPDALSCPSAGNCALAGQAQDGDDEYTFVLNETQGKWGTPQRISGLEDNSPLPQIDTISCGSPGNCAVGGSDQSGPFVASETNGIWGPADTVTVSGYQSATGGVFSVSCAAAGECTAAGQAFSDQTVGEMFLVEETAGKWGRPKEVPATKEARAAADVSVSCPAARDCSVVYALESIATYTMNETGGTWGSVRTIAGAPQLTGLSCWSPGNCAAGGAPAEGLVPVVDTERDGVWGAPQSPPGLAALETNSSGTGYGSIKAVSCGAGGGCAAVGNYQTGNAVSAPSEGFTVDEVDGTWDSAEPVPGLAALNKGNVANVFAVSCASAGNCAAGGFYSPAPGKPDQPSQAFVVNESAAGAPGNPCSATRTRKQASTTSRDWLASGGSGLNWDRRPGAFGC